MSLSFTALKPAPFWAQGFRPLGCALLCAAFLAGCGGGDSSSTGGGSTGSGSTGGGSTGGGSTGGGSSVPPAKAYFQIGGTLSGLPPTAELKLLNNGGDELTLLADGSFRFATQIIEGGAYAVTVGTQPKDQKCTVASGSGNATAAVSTVAVSCLPKQGNVTTLAGSGVLGSSDGNGSGAQFNNPFGTAVDASGDVYVADYYNHLIRKVTSAGTVTTIAGVPQISGSDDGPGSIAKFYRPTSIALDSAGNLYVSESGNHMIRKINSIGFVSTFAGSGSSGSADGVGTAATFYNPGGLAFDASGDLYVADSSNNRIRKITPAGVVTTVAGSVPGSVDGTGTAATFNFPTGLVFDQAGNLFIADRSNQRIRKMTSAGVVTTLAGSSAGRQDGVGAAARFNGPNSLTIDTDGNLFVADAFNSLIRRVSPSGLVTTYAGGTAGYSDGYGAAAAFNRSFGISIDGAGNLYLADTDNNRIRKITP